MHETPTSIAALITQVEINESSDLDLVISILIELMQNGGRNQGFWSGEIMPPADKNKSTWTVVQRFRNIEQAQAWKETDKCKEIVQKLLDAKASVAEEISEESHHAHGTVATAITTEVKPDMEDAYFAWQAKIQYAQAKHPGYRGIYWQPPSPGLPYIWHTLIRFDSPENLESWFASDIRKSLVVEQTNLVNQIKFQKLSNSFPGWVPMNTSTGEAPARWKTALMVLLSIVPLVLLQSQYLSPLLAGLQQPVLSIFLSLVASVAFTSWVAMPFLIRTFNWWLFPKQEAKAESDLKGLLIFTALLALEILLLHRVQPYLNAHR